MQPEAQSRRHRADSSSRRSRLDSRAFPCSAVYGNDPGSAPGITRRSRQNSSQTLESRRESVPLNGNTREDLPRLLYSRHQCVDVALVVVDVERCASCRRYIEPAHQWLRTVVSRTNADSFAIQDRREIVWMNVVQREAHDAAPLARRRSVDTKSFDRLESLL